MKKLLYSCIFSLCACIQTSEAPKYAPVPRNLQIPDDELPGEVIAYPVSTKQTLHITTWVDRIIDPSYYSEMTAAIQSWNYALNGNIVISTDFKPIDNIAGPFVENLKKTADNLVILMWTQYGSEYNDSYGVADRIGGKVIYFIKHNTRQDRVFKIMMHEIAHCLGADHDISSTMMHPGFYGGNYRVLDPNTMRQVAAWQNIPINDLKCVTEACKF